MSVKVFAIAAMAANRVIGRENDLPWHIPEDLKHFKSKTINQTVLMGRKTFESLPVQARPLPKRVNVVATRVGREAVGDDRVQVVEDALRYVRDVSSGKIQIETPELWIVGGEAIYRATLPLVQEISLTRLDEAVEGDAYFPEFEDQFELIDEDKREGFRFQTYRRFG